MVDLRDIPIITGNPSAKNCGNCRTSARLCAHCLAKAESRVDDDALAINAGCLAGGHPTWQEALHLGHHIGVFGAGLHVLRFTLHVHHAHRAVGAGRGLQRFGTLQAPDIIDQRRSGSDLRRG